MIKVILFVLVIALGAMAALIASRPGTFHFERSGLINAPSEKIFPYLTNFKLGSQWTPYEKMDPNMKKTYSGPDSGVGSIMAFDGNRKVGSGRLEMVTVIPNNFVEIRLTMLSPMKAENIVQYKLDTKDHGTLFTWSMSGHNNFLSKGISLFIDCDKLIGDQFSQGIQNLKQLTEK